MQKEINRFHTAMACLLTGLIVLLHSTCTVHASDAAGINIPDPVLKKAISSRGKKPIRWPIRWLRARLIRA